MPSARRRSKRKRHVAAHDDVLAPTFDAIFDRGCFHLLPPEARDG